MNVSRRIQKILPILVAVLLVVSACSSAPSKYDDVQKDTTGFKAPAAVEKGAEKGSTFNQFFPESEGEYTVVPSQEKAGFAEYKLKRDGETLAMLTINDTISLPAAAAKYDNATLTVAGFPSVVQGTTATGLLVNGRYQVKVLSRDASFTEADRSAWLEKFDLQGLAALEADTRAFRRAQTKAAKTKARLNAPTNMPTPEPEATPEVSSMPQPKPAAAPAVPSPSETPSALAPQPAG